MTQLQSAKLQTWMKSKKRATRHTKRGTCNQQHEGSLHQQHHVDFAEGHIVGNSNS